MASAEHVICKALLDTLQALLQMDDRRRSQHFVTNQMAVLDRFAW